MARCGLIDSTILKTSRLGCEMSTPRIEEAPDHGAVDVGRKIRGLHQLVVDA